MTSRNSHVSPFSNNFPTCISVSYLFVLFIVFLLAAGNPCIVEVVKSEKFDHRAYIVACCSENLEVIDGIEVEDHVRTEGEWLAIQGGIRKIGPGNHQRLCEQIACHFPKNDQGPPTPAQKSCHKALEKRKSHQIDSDRTINSVYSPFREWNGKMQKQCDLNRSLDGMMTPIKRKNQNLRMCSPPEARKNRSFTFKSKRIPYPNDVIFDCSRRTPVSC